MTNNLRQSIIKKRTWTEDELAQAHELLAVCGAYENLDIKLSLSRLRSRLGKEINDFLYYADDQLVGLLSLSNHGTEDREMTGMVHPAHRRRGIFTALLASAKAEVQQRGIQRLIIICERFSRSGQGFVAAVGAQYDFSEHRMILATLKEKGPYHQQLHLRRAEPQDIDSIVQIIALSFGQSVQGARKDIAESMQNSLSQYYVGLFHNEVIGSLDLFVHENEFGIYAFGILPQYRGRGFGRQMLEQLIKSIHHQSQQLISLEVETTNTNAIGLYRSCGFQETTSYGYYNLDII
ncbi:MAG: GNAT family N-acetyltransferase [Ktedonobacteraceae bacterium]